MTRSSLFAAAITLLGGAAVAQTPPPPPASVPPGAAPVAGGQTYRAKQVIGTRVSIAGDIAIGTVDDIVFDDAGAIEYLIVNNDGKLVTVPWTAAKFNFTTPTAPTAVINITAEQFRAIPTYTVRTYPTFYAPTYRTEVYRHYGLTPGQARRIDRDLRRP